MMQKGLYRSTIHAIAAVVVGLAAVSVTADGIGHARADEAQIDTRIKAGATKGEIQRELFGPRRGLTPVTPSTKAIERSEREHVTEKARGRQSSQQPVVADDRERAVDFDILFHTGSAELTPESMKLLDATAEVILNNKTGGREIIVEGHTDARGSEPYNLQLSEDRARAVHQYLVGKGVDPGLLRPVGRGERYLVEPNDPLSSRNRRVTCIVPSS